jgi:hypothetical protein
MAALKFSGFNKIYLKELYLFQRNQVAPANSMLRKPCTMIEFTAKDSQEYEQTLRLKEKELVQASSSTATSNMRSKRLVISSTTSTRENTRK